MVVVGRLAASSGRHLVPLLEMEQPTPRSLFQYFSRPSLRASLDLEEKASFLFSEHFGASSQDEQNLSCRKRGVHFPFYLVQINVQSSATKSDCPTPKVESQYTLKGNL